jgi:hypothetical protein
MTEQRIGTTSFLPQAFEDSLADEQAYAETLAEPNKDISALDLVSQGLSAIVVSNMAEVGRRARDRKYVEGLDPEQEGFTVEARINGYGVLYNDIQHGVYKHLAELVTGAASAEGDESKIKHGFELGERIVSQRAQEAATEIGMSFIYPGIELTELDKEKGTTLFERVNAYYLNSRNRSPLARTPKEDGMKFEDLLGQLGKTRNSLPDSTTGQQRPGYLKRVSNGAKVTKLSLSMARRAQNKAKAAEVMEEMFDTYVPSPWFEISDSNALFVVNFGLKALKHYEQAAKADIEIAGDPRIKYIGLLTSRLTSFNVVRENESFKRAVRIVAQNERSRSS